MIELDTQKYFRVQMVLFKCKESLSKLFEEKWEKITQILWKNDALSGKKFTNGMGKSVYLNSKRIQKSLLENGDVHCWDLTLLGEVFKLPEFYDAKLDRKLKNLISIRNNVAHNGDLKVLEPDFQKYFLEISDFLTIFNYPKEEIERIKIEDIFKEEKAKNPLNSEISEAIKLKNLGNKAFEKKEYLDAVNFYTKAIATGGVSDTDLSILYRNRATAYYFIYLSSKDETDILQSIMDAKQSVHLNPLSFKAYLKLANSYEKLEKFDKAIVNLEKALKLQPGNKEIIDDLAKIKWEQGSRERMEHLDPRLQPKSSEESKDEMINTLKEIGINLTGNNIEEIEEYIEKMDPSFKDVRLANKYRDGSQALEQNYQKAAQLYAKAAKKNNAEALFNLANLTREGKGVTRDYKLAFTFYENAANQQNFLQYKEMKIPNVGVAESQCVIGNLYRTGEYVVQDFGLAICWYEKAVQGGSDIAANNLGLMYGHGTGVPKDFYKAEKYLLLAHERNDPNAANNLSQLYIAWEDGKNALKWHEISLKNGNYYSMSKDKANREQIKNIFENSVFSSILNSPRLFSLSVIGLFFLLVMMIGFWNVLVLSVLLVGIWKAIKN